MVTSNRCKTSELKLNLTLTSDGRTLRNRRASMTASSCCTIVGLDNVESWIATLRSGECLSERSLRQLCQAASELLMEESNVQPVSSPVRINCLKLEITCLEADLSWRRRLCPLEWLNCLVLRKIQYSRPNLVLRMRPAMACLAGEPSTSCIESVRFNFESKG